MGFRFRDAFIGGYLLDENIRLYAADRFTPTASSSVWFYFRVLAAGLLPWTGIIVGRLYDDVRAAWRRDGSLDPVDVLLVELDDRHRRLFHVLEVQARSLRVSDCADALPAVRARVGRRCAIGRTIGGTPARASDSGWSVRCCWWSRSVGGYMLIARLALPAAALVVPAAVGGAGTGADAGR